MKKDYPFILTAGVMVTPKGREPYSLKIIDLEPNPSKGLLLRVCHILNERFNKNEKPK